MWTQQLPWHQHLLLVRLTAAPLAKEPVQPSERLSRALLLSPPMQIPTSGLRSFLGVFILYQVCRRALSLLLYHFSLLLPFRRVKAELPIYPAFNLWQGNLSLCPVRVHITLLGCHCAPKYVSQKPAPTLSWTCLLGAEPALLRGPWPVWVQETSSLQSWHGTSHCISRTILSHSDTIWFHLATFFFSSLNNVAHWISAFRRGKQLSGLELTWVWRSGYDQLYFSTNQFKKVNARLIG